MSPIRNDFSLRFRRIDATTRVSGKVLLSLLSDFLRLTASNLRGK